MSFLKSNNYAFSITELLICLFLISLLAGSGLFHASGVFSKNRLLRETKAIGDLIDHQALEAAAINNDLTVTFELPNKIFVNNSQVPNFRKQIFRLSDELTIIRAQFANISSAPHSLTLRAHGSATPGTIIIADKRNNTCSITQALRGLRTIKCMKK